jgi:hypothetical protein
MIRKFVTTAVALLILTPSAVLGQALLSVEAIGSTPAKFDQKQVNVRGYVFTNKLGRTRIYSSARDASSGKISSAIDLLPLKPRNMLGVYKHVACATVAGTFRPYSDSLTSPDKPAGKVGVLYVSIIHLCEASGVAR